MEDSLRYWIWFRRHTRPASAAGRLLLERYSSPEEIYALDAAELKKIKGLTKEDVKELSLKDLEASDPILAYCKKQKIRILTLRDPEYPLALLDLSSPPLVLFCWGCLPDFSKMQAVSVVGTRSMSDYGKRMTYALSYELASVGIAIVSGMALGVDAVSAAGAIAVGGVAIAVLGCGFGNIYPRDHKDLMVEIARRGLVITEYLPGDEPESSHFPKRNRIIAALSGGTVVVEAGAKSGALITADYAKRLGRPVFVYPQNADEPNAAGTNFLAKNGATLVTASNDVLEAMGLTELEQGIPFEIMPSADQMIKRLRIASRPYKSPTNSSAAVLPDRVTLRRIKAHLAEEEDLTVTPAAWDEGFETDLQNAPPLTEEDMEKIVEDIEQMIDEDAARLYLRIPPTAEGIQADFLKAVTDDPQKTSELLTSLELFGFVERLSGGFYRRNLIF